MKSPAIARRSSQFVGGQFKPAFGTQHPHPQPSQIQRADHLSTENQNSDAASSAPRPAPPRRPAQSPKPPRPACRHRAAHAVTRAVDQRQQHRGPGWQSPPARRRQSSREVVFMLRLRSNRLEDPLGRCRVRRQLVRGRRGRASSSPPQLGQVFCSLLPAQSLQKVHSKVQIRASRVAGRSRLQHSQLGRSWSMANPMQWWGQKCLNFAA